MKSDQIPGANQDAGGIPVYPGEVPRNLAAPEGLSLDVERLAEAIDNVVGDLRVVGEAGDIAAEYNRLGSGSPGEDR